MDRQIDAKERYRQNHHHILYDGGGRNTFETAQINKGRNHGESR